MIPARKISRNRVNKVAFFHHQLLPETAENNTIIYSLQPIVKEIVEKLERAGKLPAASGITQYAMPKQILPGTKHTRLQISCKRNIARMSYNVRFGKNS
jgi:hypothetical protein